MGATYKKIEIVGTSSESVSEAIESAIERASETVDSMGWFEVSEVRGRLDDGGVTEYQVGLKVGFKLKD